VSDENKLFRGSEVPLALKSTRLSALPGESGVCAGCGTMAFPDEPCAVCGKGPEDALLGTLVGGKYRIEALLGAGGMGRVYRAVHTELHEPVAVKFLLPEWSSRAELRARFRREAVVLARLRHPNVVSVLDYGEHEGELFLVMELLRGFSLDSQVKAGGVTLPIERVVRIIDQVLQVLEAAHTTGVVHRDLKPENVMLLDAGDRTDRVKVLDFGIAFLDEEGADKLTSTGTVRGTPHYMSPEQCVGRNVGPPTDVYAVGAMLYELLAGTPPFNGRSAAEIISQQMFSAPPSFAELSPPREIPTGLEALCLRALSKRPEKRPDAAQFRDGLHRAVLGVDPTSVAARDAHDRARSAGLSREERALSSASREPSSEGPAGDTGPSPRVALWGFADERATALRTALAVQGMTAFSVATMGPLSPDKRPWKAVVIAGGNAADERTRTVRATPELTMLPVVVVDMPRATDAPILIRAGASDCALASVDDVAVCQKVLRALRRGR
jgi:eukaryotic-like serine/threonine-protein kinase